METFHVDTAKFQIGFQWNNKYMQSGVMPSSLAEQRTPVGCFKESLREFARWGTFFFFFFLTQSFSPNLQPLISDTFDF